MKTPAAFYAGIGPTLSHYTIDVNSCTLVKSAELLLPNNIQAGWPHSHLPVLYVSCGVPSPGDSAGDWACAVRLDPDTGAPSLLGPAARLPSRALHLTTDRSSEHLLLAHNRPASLSVFRLDPAGPIAGRLEQRPGIDTGIFPHQVRVTPDNRFCISVARGLPYPHEWKASREPQAEPGSLHVFDYEDGRLGKSLTVRLGDGHHFGPRNLDFDRSGSWVYLGLETQNEIVVFATDRNGQLRAKPLQRFSTLRDPDAHIHQGVGPVLVHPQRSVLYVANRAYQPMAASTATKVIAAAAENSIVVYAIDPARGLLTEIQRVRSGGACPRTISLDPSGQMLVVANSETYGVENVDGVLRVPMNLSTFRVLEDGRLELVNVYPTGDGSGPEIAWSGMASY